MWVGPAWEAYQLCPATLYFYFKLEECGPVQEEIVELGWVAGFSGGVEFDPPKESILGGRMRRTLCTTSERGFNYCFSLLT
jgi:hypothetical protein